MLHRCERYTSDWKGTLWFPTHIGKRYIDMMTTPVKNIRFEALLQRPASPRSASWCFVLLPVEASDQLPTRSMVSVEGTLGGMTFKTTLSPDGQGSHWLKVPKALRDAAGVEAGDIVSLDIAPTRVEPAVRVPADLRDALAAHPDAKAQWASLTPIARRDWIQWLASSKQPETRARRIRNTCNMLASGKRRVCCFDRSGMYSKSIKAPTAAE